jgi:hypothetical protein
MEHNKTININPDLFKLPEKKTRKQQSNKIKFANNTTTNPSPKKNKSIKTKLLKYIREKQEEKYKQKYDELSQNASNKNIISILNSNNKEEELNDFKQSLDYFNLNTNNSEINKNPSSSSSSSPSPLNNTIKHHPIIEQPDTLFFQPLLSSSFNKTNEPKYGCLKNGKLPTYKTFMNKTRHNSTINVNPQIIISNPSQQTGKIKFDNKNNVNGFSSLNNNENENHNNQDTISEMKKLQDKIFKNNQAYKIPKYLKKKKTFKKTFHLGKSKYHPQVSVLIPNKTVRTRITTQSQLLKQVPIENVKKYLITNGFIKIGSNAPDDVLRKIYESANMIGGEVTNHNSENLLYNYLNSNDSSL